MKKSITVVLLCLTLCVLIGCSSSSNTETPTSPMETTSTFTETTTLSPEESQKQKNEADINEVKILIEVINFSTDASTMEWQISRAEQAYNELDDSLKEKIDNYSRISTAWKKYQYKYIEEHTKKYMTSLITGALKDPDSFKETFSYVSIYYDENKETPLLVFGKMSFTATNSFGGRVKDSESFFFKVIDGKRVEVFTAYNYDSDYIDHAMNNGVLLNYNEIG